MKAIAAELKKYDPGLAKKPRWLVFNKADLLDEKERKRRAAALVKKLRWTKPWFVVSAINGQGTKELTYAVMEFLEEQRTLSQGNRKRNRSPTLSPALSQGIGGETVAPPSPRPSPKGEGDFSLLSFRDPMVSPAT